LAILEAVVFLPLSVDFGSITASASAGSVFLALLVLASRLVRQFIGLREPGILVSHHLLLPVVRHQQATRVVFRSPVERQPNVVTADDLVRRLLLVLQPVNLLD